MNAPPSNDAARGITSRASATDHESCLEDATPSIPEGERFALVLRAERWNTPGGEPVHRLRLALKCLLRRFGLRCESVAPVTEGGAR